MEIIKPAKYIPKYRTECGRCGAVFDMSLNEWRTMETYIRCPFCENHIENNEFKLVKIKIKKGKRK